MRFKEFENRVNDINDFIEVKRESDITTLSIGREVIVTISELYSRKLSIEREVQNEIFDLCTEYARTPLRLRREPKLYRVILPDESRLNPQICTTLRSVKDGSVVLVQCGIENISTNNCFTLTEEQKRGN